MADNVKRSSREKRSTPSTTSRKDETTKPTGASRSRQSSQSREPSDPSKATKKRQPSLSKDVEPKPRQSSLSRDPKPKPRQPPALSSKDAVSKTRQPSQTRDGNPPRAPTKPTDPKRVTKTKPTPADAPSRPRRMVEVDGSSRKESKKETERVRRSLVSKVGVSETLPKKRDLVGPGRGASSKKEKEMKVTKSEASLSASRLSRDRTRTRTLDPEESQLAKIVAAQVTKKEPEVTNQDDEEPIEEEYESDFEEDSASADSCISATDSGACTAEEDALPRELTSKPPSPPRLVTSGVSHHAVTRSSHSPLATTISQSTSGPLPSPLKSGMKETLHAASRATKREGDISVKGTSINFALARQRQANQLASARARARGRELLAMIRLDTVSATLLNLPPSQYEVFMSSHGTGNTTQAQVQAKAEGLEEETQTDEILLVDHWTQHPPCLLSDTDHQGLQCAGPREESNKMLQSSFDVQKLQRFLGFASEVILAVLNEEPSTYTEDENLGSHPLGADLRLLGERGLNLGSGCRDLLKGRTVQQISFCDQGPPPRLVSLHPSTTWDDLSLICVWSSSEPTLPRHVLGSRGEVTVLCLHPSLPHLVIAGLEDGTICLWDLQESSHHHPIHRGEGQDFRVRTPAYTTGCKGEPHDWPVVAVRALQGSQVVSLDQSGVLAVWSVLRLPSTLAGRPCIQQQPSVQQSPWGRSQLVLSSSMVLDFSPHLGVHIEEEAEFIDLQVTRERIVVTLDSGDVVSSTLVPSKQGTRVYSTCQDNGAVQGTQAFAVCPHGTPYFVVADRNGNLNLYNLKTSRPLVSTSRRVVASQQTSTVQLHWSKDGPLFVLDPSTSMIQAWKVTHTKFELLVNCCLGADVSAFAVSSNQRMAIATTKEEIYLISINSDVCTSNNFI